MILSQNDCAGSGSLRIRPEGKDPATALYFPVLSSHDWAGRSPPRVEPLKSEINTPIVDRQWGCFAPMTRTWKGEMLVKWTIGGGG